MLFFSAGKYDSVWPAEASLFQKQAAVRNVTHPMSAEADGLPFSVLTLDIHRGPV